MITVTVLTKKQDGRGHHSTEVTIDFSNISQEQLLLLARARIIERWRHAMSYSKEAIPQADYLRAEDFVQPDDACEDVPLDLPKKRDRVLDNLLDGMSKQDREYALRLLEEL